MAIAQREVINKELISRYKKDKIRNYLYENEKNLSAEEVENKVNELWKNASENLELINKSCGFVIVNYSDDYDMAALLKYKKTKKRAKKSFCINDIERIKSDITSYSFNMSLYKVGKTYNVHISDLSGLFKIIFSDGSFMYYSKWVSGAGKSRTVEGMFAAEKSVWLEFLKMVKIQKKNNAKPKNGIYRISTNQMSGGLDYKKLEALQETPIIHPSTETLLQDITYYYDNVPLFTRFGMSGVRKCLMVGPPGTGKTSLAIKVAKKFAHNKCVVFSTSISDVAQHLVKCSTYKVSTLVILEDAESTLQQANSSLLNFLDGVDQPKNLLGSYIIMTTNFPARIEPRILQRPGRVDRIIEFGNLSGAHAIKCAEIYFEEILFNDKNRSTTKIGKKLREDLYSVINNMSGAQIKELAQASASFAVSQNKDVTVELIKSVQKRMKDDINNIMKYAAEESSMTKRKGVGFTENNDLLSSFSEKFLEPMEAL